MKLEDIFGRPNEGVHKSRFGGVAFIDLLFTFIGAYILYFFTDIPFSITLTVLMLLSFLLHYLFGVKTASQKYFNKFF